ncbi:PREDICTED: UDP-glucuronosyltransferase 2B15-like [Nicrophorus vespilloides]|uniref:UDP-glucuronosyltransferase n=1 Tax=Nicrophorus vespilloides TaxID=110193 RepID=A0ABM1NCP3_NICVS|nr:PREDICTED: UDP-glucuronosyltransferase 2B15-like [Nicrophorus vespilloides]
MERPAILVLVLASLFSAGCCANILGIFAMPSYSHYTLGHRLLEELAARGHQVTMIAPYKQDKPIPNYKEIYLEGLADIIGEQKTVFFDMENMYPVNQVILCYKLGYTFCDFVLKYKPVLDFINSNVTVDVVIMDQFLNEALVGIAHQLKAPLIYFSTLGTSIWNNHLVGNPAPMSHIPHNYLDYQGKMDLSERMHNFFLNSIEEIYRRLIAFPFHDKLLHETFPDAPPLHELLYKRDSFVLVNSHISVNDPTPHVPNMIEIGGFHPKARELSKDLQKFLDEAPHGVIFFGLGSNLRSSSLPKEKRDAILKALSKLKQKVLWKWEDETLPGQPPNVKLGKWFPQQSILAHPNVKGFISHGGLLSTIEAVYFGVPIIGIPIYADQKMNINLAVNRGYAAMVPFKELTEEKLTWALNEILNKTCYRENVKKRSSLMNDRPMNPLQEAVYWVEHIIRHKGASHFRNGAMDLKWYQYEMVDVAILVGSAVILTLIIIIVAIRKALSPKHKNQKSKRKTQ